ncbi:Eukaryotic translation initiation factor 3 subunit B-like protein [Dinothrombium tinctorium]|uniref:Eukaryotic translation initiation factor 3 subunit B n=1 Tax=Dinothrombium tinctorium TaxID=1965070 RepID=A0A443RJA3_9ACAR|nr:Eukaryotic translation initiation factor 3 subunit B-like protein [Dinothrombium tinctorium]
MAEGELIANESGEKKEENSTNALLENGIEEEPSFSDPEDFVDDIKDEELVPELLRKKPKEYEGFDTFIVVDHIPQVGSDRFPKLKTVMNKLFSKFGRIVNDYYAMDENGNTKGYMFIEYETPEQALEAVKVTDGNRLDKQHILAVNLFNDIEKYANVPEQWDPPKPQPYEDKGNLRYWLLDPDCYDQYSVLYDGGEMTAVFLNSNPQPTLIKERKLWTETVVLWSPLGTYLATFHKRGIALWAGEEFTQFNRFAHEGVSLIDFSPCEKYLVTFSPQLAATDDPQAIIVWDVRTAVKRRSFHADHEHIVWPIFKWSIDDKYFAKVSQDTLSIYETPSMMLLDKKSMKIPGIRNFSWSPSQNLMAYWVAEDKDVPARVTLIEIPSRKELRAKNLFSVADCRMHWQKAGDYLCVKVDRYTKAKKEKNESKYSGLYYNFEIFHMREKQIPVDSIEIKEGIVAFSWEPVGSKFAIIHGDGPQLYSVSFYGIKQGATVSLLKKFENKQCNHLFWSPAGQHIVLAGLRNMNNSLEFVDTSDFTITATTEHFMATDVEWDPTGRYVVTGVSFWAHKGDNAYWVWSFQGRLIRKHALDNFCQLLWRPRPPSLLSEEKLKEIKKNLKKYSSEFDIKDRMVLSKVSKDILERRKRMMNEFRNYHEKRTDHLKAQKTAFLELRYGDKNQDENEADNIEEETVEFFVKQEEIVIDEEE